MKKKLFTGAIVLAVLGAAISGVKASTGPAGVGETFHCHDAPIICYQTNGITVYGIYEAGPSGPGANN